MISRQRASYLQNLCIGWKTEKIELMKKLLTPDEKHDLMRFIVLNFTYPSPLDNPKAWPNALGYFADGRVNEDGTIKRVRYADMGADAAIDTARERT